MLSSVNLAVFLAALVLVDCQNISSCNSTTVDCTGELLSLDESDYIRLSNDSVLYNNQLLLLGTQCVSSNQTLLACVQGSEPFSNCTTDLVVLNDGGFEVVYEYYDYDYILDFDSEDYFLVVAVDVFGGAVICPDETIEVEQEDNSMLVSVTIITFIGSSLSVIGSTLVLLTYGIFKSLRTLPSLILMNLATATLIVDIHAIVQNALNISFSHNEGFCVYIAIISHFFGLAQFTWMSIMSFQLTKTFYDAQKLRPVSSKESRVYFTVYMIIGWGLPLIIISISIILNFTVENALNYGVSICFINDPNSIIISFFIPLGITLLINTVFSISTTVLVCRSAIASSKLSKQQNLVYLRLNIAVFSVTGLTWVFGIVAFYTSASWAWYPFTIFNSTQGFVIFLAFVLTRRIISLYFNLFKCKKAEESTGLTRTHTVVYEAKNPNPEV